MKNLNIKQEKIRDKLLSADGREMLVYSIETPKIEEIKKFNDFYEKIQEKALDFCREKLPKRLSTENIYSYKLSCKCHVENCRVTVTLRAALTNRTIHKIISEHTEKHKWDFDCMKFRVVK